MKTLRDLAEELFVLMTIGDDRAPRQRTSPRRSAIDPTGLTEVRRSGTAIVNGLEHTR